MKEQIRAWMNEKIVKGFYRAHSWLLNFFAFVIAVLPDVINLAISNIDSLVGSIPTLSVEHKLHLLMAVNVLSLFLKAYKQRKGPIAIAERETVEATEVFLQGAEVLGPPIAARSNADEIVKEIERYMVDSINRRSGDFYEALRSSGGGASFSARLKQEDGAEAIIPVRRDPDGSLSVGDAK